ncbi:MAG: hypothetical protein WCT39_04715 [Candidatus Margulisiibacteriota bacterium]
MKLKPLAERKHDLDLSIIQLLSASKNLIDAKWREIAARTIKAKSAGAAIILMLGGHVIRSGVQNYLIDLMERGYVSCLAVNGAILIHDFELALIGKTTESVARYIKEGQFGLWQETGRINDIINEAYKNGDDIGLGEAIGQAIHEGNFPHKEISLFATAYRLNIPITVHVGIGYDIIHEHPNCDGAATGALSYNDFLKFAAVVQNLENGIVMNFGSAVMAPEVFLKALSMARNVAFQKGHSICHFTTVVCDLLDLPNHEQEPAKNDHRYYFRPWKTMLIRTTSEGGQSYYIQGRHAETLPILWTAINEAENLQ